MSGATRVHYEDSFIMVGGEIDNRKNLDTMLKYQPETDTWIELGGKMRRGRYGTIAFVVDEAIFQVRYTLKVGRHTY